MHFSSLLALVAGVGAVQLNPDNPDSVKHSAATIAHGLMSYYKGNASVGATEVGILPQPYYWWEAGAMWGGMLDYFRLTGDTSYNEVTTQALLSQVGPAFDYMVPAHRFEEGNDDQAYWGFSVMSAAEMNYPPPPKGTPSWLQMVINLLNTQHRRWDTSSCGGGFRWQIFPENKGYDYKNSVSSSAFFLLAARLARYTGNQTYVDWATQAYDWTTSVGLLDSKTFAVYDGAGVEANCTGIDHTRYTYNAATFLYGASVMYNYTGNSVWLDRTRGLLTSTQSFFFSPFKNATDVMFEHACEEVSMCNTDAQSFKAYLARFMWATTQMTPTLSPTITRLMRRSASGAAASCSGGKDGVTCGSRWYTNKWDGLFGVGEQLSALEVIQGVLTPGSKAPMHAEGVKLGTPQKDTPPPPPPPAPAPAPAPAKPKRSGGVLRRRLGRAVGASVALGVANVA